MKGDYGTPQIGDKVELSDHATRITSTFELGTDFANDGNVIMSDQQYRDYFSVPGSTRDKLADVDVGLLKVRPGVSVVEALEEVRRALPDDVRVHGQPEPKFGHRQEFGNDAKHLADFSAVTHVAKGKNIPPFLILYVGSHPTTSAQAQRLAAVLKDYGIPVTLFGAKNTWHTKLNDDLGLPDDPATKALDDFLAKGLKK